MLNAGKFAEDRFPLYPRCRRPWQDGAFLGGICEAVPKLGLDLFVVPRDNSADVKQNKFGFVRAAVSSLQPLSLGFDIYLREMFVIYSQSRCFVIKS